MDEGDCSVRVVARFRPINDRERAEGEKRQFRLEISDTNISIDASGGTQKPYQFNFDRCFAPGSLQVRLIRSKFNRD